MLEEIRTMLGVVEGQLLVLWRKYLGSKPGDWFSDPRKAAGRLAEMREVLTSIRILQDDIHRMQLALNSPNFKPLREKEKESCTPSEPT